MAAQVAIVGRPNVGKSTLFNRLAGRRLALVDDRPGVTRDRREQTARWGALDLTLVDTAGLEGAAKSELAAKMLAQTETAVAKAELVLFVIDARAGVTALDRDIAQDLHRLGARVVVVANKAEGRAGSDGVIDAFALGLGEPIAVSAAHGEGMVELYQAMVDALGIGPETAPAPAEAPLRLAIVGRPNTGKSTLLNSLIGEERMITGPDPGVTRDAIAVDWRYHDRAIRLVDTAGIRKRPRVVERLEQISVADSLRAIRAAEVAILVIDAVQGLERQDLTVANLVIDEGRALVVAANKWDLVADPTERRRAIEDRLTSGLSQLPGVELCPISAARGAGIDRLMAAVLRVHALWNRRQPTAALNRWLADAVAFHPPPLVRGRRIKLRYLTQVTTRPPTFVLFASVIKGLPDSYQRYLVNEMRRAFALPGIPIRLLLRAGKNPYVKDV